MLFFFPRDEPYFRDSLAAHRALGLPTEALDQAEMARRFPMIDFERIEVGLFEPGFGALMARRAVQTLVERFVRDGGIYVRAAGAAAARRPPAELDVIRLHRASGIAADRFVFALGPWLPKLFPDVIGRRIVADPAGSVLLRAARRRPPLPARRDARLGRLQRRRHLSTASPTSRAAASSSPTTRMAPVVDPDTQDRRPSEAALAEIVAFRDRRFPLLRGAPLTEARVCQYENSSNGDFLIDFHPRWPMSCWSAAGRATASSTAPKSAATRPGGCSASSKAEPRFSLATKGETHKREVH